MTTRRQIRSKADKFAEKWLADNAMRKHPDVQRKFMEKIRAGKSEKECVEWVYMMAFCTLFGPPSKEPKAEGQVSNPHGSTS